MPPPPLPRRVQILEEKVDSLERLPARIGALELQILQFREEVRADFSATRDGLRAEIRALIAEGDAETRRYMRVLREEVIATIVTLGEGRPPRE